jgi:hypothetical protein
MSTSEGTSSLIIVESESSYGHTDSVINNNPGSNISTSIADVPFSSRAINPIISNSEGDPSDVHSESDAHVILHPQPRKNPIHNRAPPIKMQDFVTYTTKHPICFFYISSPLICSYYFSYYYF